MKYKTLQITKYIVSVQGICNNRQSLSTCLHMCSLNAPIEDDPRTAMLFYNEYVAWQLHTDTEQTHVETNETSVTQKSISKLPTNQFSLIISNCVKCDAKRRNGNL